MIALPEKRWPQLFLPPAFPFLALGGRGLFGSVPNRHHRGRLGRGGRDALCNTCRDLWPRPLATTSSSILEE